MAHATPRRGVVVTATVTMIASTICAVLSLHHTQAHIAATKAAASHGRHTASRRPLFPQNRHRQMIRHRHIRFEAAHAAEPMPRTHLDRG